MTVMAFYSNGEIANNEPIKSIELKKLVAECVLYNCTAIVEKDKITNQPVVSGNPTEVALINHLIRSDGPVNEILNNQKTSGY